MAEKMSVDALAQEIRRVDGNHSLGAGALAEALMPFILQALSPGSTGSAEGWHGPFGYLVCPIGLDESHWWISDDPVKDEGSFCLPMFTSEDPFAPAPLDAALPDDPTSEALDLVIELRAENAALRERLGEPDLEKPELSALLKRLGHGGR